MRGLLIHAYTRVHFSDEAAANQANPILNQVPEARRGTLIAPRQVGPDLLAYWHDPVLQGERETAFFDIQTGVRRWQAIALASRAIYTGCVVLALEIA